MIVVALFRTGQLISRRGELGRCGLGCAGLLSARDGRLRHGNLGIRRGIAGTADQATARDSGQRRCSGQA